jgi:hypothetical protein
MEEGAAMGGGREGFSTAAAAASPAEHRDRRVSWDADPERVLFEDLPPGAPGCSAGAPGLPRAWHVPTIAYLHLAALLGAVCMTKDGVSLGYVALFLVGCAILTERSVWAMRTRRGLAFLSSCPFGGARGGGLLINAYVVVVLAFSAAALLFHMRMLGVKVPKTPDDTKSKDGRMFLTIVCAGFDAAALFTAVAVATAEKIVAGEHSPVQVHAVQEMAVMRHVLAALAASLKPCALTAPYLLYALMNIWCWTMRVDGGGGGGGGGGCCGQKGLLPHKLLGYYTGVHIFCVYLFGASLDGISVTVPCPLAQTLGLEPLASWSQAAWACHFSLLLLFFASFTKVYRMSASSVSASPSRRPLGSPTLRRRSVPPPEIEQSLLHADAPQSFPAVADVDGSGVGQADRATVGVVGGGMMDMAGDRAASHGFNRKDSRGEEAWMEWGWWGREVISQLCGAAVLVWPLMMPSILAAPLLAGALVLLSQSIGPRTSSPFSSLVDMSFATVYRVMVSIGILCTLILASQMTLQVAMFAQQDCAKKEQEHLEWLDLLGLSPFKLGCGLQCAGSDAGDEGGEDGGELHCWPLCTGVPALVLQLSILHVVCLFTRVSLYLERRSAAIHVSPAAGGRDEGVEDGGREDTRGWVDTEETHSRILISKLLGKGTGFTGVVVLFVYALAVADVKHFGCVSFSIALCSAGRRVSALVWPQAIKYLAFSIVVDFVWHLKSSLPPVPILGLGLTREDALWSWDALGAELLVYVLLTQHQLHLARAQTLQRHLDGMSNRGAEAGGVDAGDEEDERLWVEKIAYAGLCKVQALWRQGEAVWQMLGCYLLYVVMLLHALGLSQAGTWAWDGAPCRPTAMSLLYLLGLFMFVMTHCLHGWRGHGMVAALRVWYVVMPSAVLLLALRYVAQFPGVSDFLQLTLGQSLGPDTLVDLGLALAPAKEGAGGDVFWALLGDALVVGVLAGQPRRLSRAARLHASQESLLLWWRDVVDTFGDAILQVALFLAVDKRQSLIGLGYLLLTVLFLMRPDLIQQLWLLPLVYAQSICLVQLAAHLSIVVSAVHTLDPACPSGAECVGVASGGSNDCWMGWAGLNTCPLAYAKPDSMLILISRGLPCPSLLAPLFRTPSCFSVLHCSLASLQTA